MSKPADNRPGQIGGVRLEEAYRFLDQLREEGVINVFGAVAYLQDMFGLDYEDAKKMLSYWMKDFSDE